MQTVIQKSKIYPESYINLQTGELLSDEFPDVTSVNRKTKSVIIDYTDYVVVDRSVMKFLIDVLKPQDIGRINAMINDIESYRNILMNEEIPHTNESLAKRLKYTRTKYNKFMNMMYKASIIYKLTGYKNGVEQSCFILNPYLAKSTKITNKDILVFFDNLTLTTAQNKIKMILKALDESEK